MDLVLVLPSVEIHLFRVEAQPKEVLKAMRKARPKETLTELVKAFLLGLLKEIRKARPKVIRMATPKELLMDLVLGLLEVEL